MANAFLDERTIARTALGLLQRELVLPRLVTRLGLSDFVGQENDTVNLRIKAILTAREYEWRTRTNPIVLDDIEETSIPVTLNKHPYSAVAITDEELTLDIASFGEQVLQPQVRAVAEQLESYIATAMDHGNYADTIGLQNSANGAWNALVEARRILNVANVPQAGRVAVLGSNVEAEFLRTDLFVKANESGSTNALEDAMLGRKAGFTVLGGVNSIDANSAYFFHPSAYAFANVAPAVAAGVVKGSSQTYQGLAMTWIQDYDAAYLRDRSIVSAFAGAASVADGRNDAGELTHENVRSVKLSYFPNS